MFCELNFKQYIGKKISETRKNNNLNTNEFACILGVSPLTVRKWELGKILPTLSNVVNICNKFSVSLDSFIND